MTVDYHVHLQEGPYNNAWLQKTSEALKKVESRSSKEAMTQHLELIIEHLNTAGYCESYLDAYLARAKKLNLKEVGIVDHLNRFYEAREYYENHMILDDSDLGQKQRRWFEDVMVTSLDEFVEFINSQKKKWHEAGVKLRLGIEMDYFIGGEDELVPFITNYPWDFVIGSVHFQDGWGFDNPDVAYLFKEKPLLEIYDRHFETVEAMIQSGLFDFVTHLDNIKLFGYRPDEHILMPYYERIAKQLVEHDLVTEVNSGLKYRYPIGESCPSPMFLDVLISNDVKLTLSSDAHYAHHLGMYVDENETILKAKGVKTVWAFEKRMRHFIQI